MATHRHTYLQTKGYPTQYIFVEQIGKWLVPRVQRAILNGSRIYYFLIPSPCTNWLLIYTIKSTFAPSYAFPGAASDAYHLMDATYFLPIVCLSQTK